MPSKAMARSGARCLARGRTCKGGLVPHTSASLYVVDSSITLQSKCISCSIVFYADDLGYGDIAGFGGHPNSDTPELDALIARGMRFNSMYSSSPVCSPSRSSVMTGRLMTRTGVWPGVFSPNSKGGLALNETTLPQLLRDHAHYDTMMVGKW